MTNPKVQTVSINGNRHYKHPNIKNMVAPSVTSIVGMLPSPYLPKWNSKVTAEAAINEREHIDSLLGVAGGKVKAIDWLKAAAERELNKAADTGTRVHEAIEQLIIDPDYKYDDDLLPYLHGFWEFEKRFAPTSPPCSLRISMGGPPLKSDPRFIGSSGAISTSCKPPLIPPCEKLIEGGGSGRFIDTLIV